MCLMQSRAHLLFLSQCCRVQMVSCLGDICFAKIHTTLWMHANSLTLLEKWIDNGGFNPEHMVDGDYSCSTAILLVFTPDAQLKDIESVGIRLVVHWLRGPLGQISSMFNLIFVHLQGAGVQERFIQSSMKDVLYDHQQLWWALGLCH